MHSSSIITASIFALLNKGQDKLSNPPDTIVTTVASSAAIAASLAVANVPAFVVPEVKDPARASAEEAVGQIQGPSITLIYSDCVSTQSFGDFSAAGELAYAAHRYFTKINYNSRCIIVSSKEGISQFQKLYQKEPEEKNQLTVHGVSFTCTTLEEIIAAKRQNEIAHYIEIGRCRFAPTELVRMATNPATQYLFVGLAHNNHAYEMDGYYLEYESEHRQGRVSTLLQGFGGDRIGVTVYNGPVAELDHAAYRNVTRQPFGFAYFALKNDSQDISFVKDYLTVARQLAPYYTNHFVIVGNTDEILKGAKGYLASKEEEKQIVVFKPKQKECYVIDYNHQNKTCTMTKVDYESYVDVEERLTKIVALEQVEHEQMRALMKHSIPFMGVTGVASMLEALMFGKIPFYEFRDHNLAMLSSYSKKHELIFSNDPDEKKAIELFNLLFWYKGSGHSVEKINELARLLNDMSLRNKMINANLMIMEQSDTVMSAIYNALNKQKSLSARIAANAKVEPEDHSFRLFAPAAAKVEVSMVGPAEDASTIEFLAMLKQKGF